MVMFLVFLLSFFASFNVFAEQFRFAVGTDLFQAQYNPQRIKFDDYNSFKEPQNNITRLSIGVSYQPFKDKYFWIALRTNRLINAPITTTAFDTVLQQDVDVRQKLIADSLVFQTAIHPKILPYFVISRANSQTEIMYKNGRYSSSDITTLLYGFGFSVPFDKHSISFTYFLGNKDFNTKQAFGISYNYLIGGF